MELTKRDITHKNKVLKRVEGVNYQAWGFYYIIILNDVCISKNGANNQTSDHLEHIMWINGLNLITIR